MTAILMRARHELRLRWRALLSLALIVGVGGAVVLASLAAARRTNSTYPRFLKAMKAYDGLLSINDTNDTLTDDVEIAKLHRLQKLPVVIDSDVAELYAVGTESAGDIPGVRITLPSGRTISFPDVFPIASEAGRFGTTLNGAKILEGRPADPTRADELITNTGVADDFKLKIGEVLEFRAGAISRKVRLVGIAAIPGQIDKTSGGYIPVILLTPAFFRENAFKAQRGGPVLIVRLRGRENGIPELEREATAAGEHISEVTFQSPQTLGIERSNRFEVVGLELFAALAALAILSVFGQLLARQIFLDADEHASLRALGMTKMQLISLSLIRALVVALAAGVIATSAAILLSGLTPIGPMRQLELNPGISIDWYVLGLGLFGLIVVVELLAFIPAWRAARQSLAEEKTERANPAANALARSSFPPTAVAGVRLALEPGRGSTAVPVRTAIFGTVLAIAALTAALTFGSSIDRLVASPRLAGWNFDAIVGEQPGTAEQIRKRLLDDGTAASVVLGSLPDMRIGKQIVNVLAMDAGVFGPTLISGRLPTGADEIALGPRTLRVMKKAVGKSIDVQPLNDSGDPATSTPLHLRIVGVVSTPKFFFSQTESGDGAAVSFNAVRAAAPDRAPDSLFIRFSPGVDLATGIARIREVATGNTFVVSRTQPGDLRNLQRVSNLPDVLAGLLALLAAATLVHTLVTSVRRRRRDLAILKTLGFVRRQVRLAVVWQTTTLVVVALAFGLPIGAIAGRWGFHAFVDQLGFVPEPVVPILAILLTIPAALVLSNLIASVPARAAARTQPAIALRAE